MDRPNDSIVISGAGLITPLGLSREATWEAVRAGRCGLGPLSAMEQSLPPGSTGGQVPDLPDDDSHGLSREVRYLRRAIAEALADAGLDQQKTCSPDRCGFMLGTTLHGMRAAGQFLRSNDPAFLSNFLGGATLNQAITGIPFTGFSATGCSACSSSLGSIGLGVSLLRSGQLDLIVAGGYDTISEYVYGGFNSLRLVAPGALRPFTRDRQGMKLAEGYGIVILERATDAARRGARPLATVLGYGESTDAHHLTQPHPEGEGAARAMNGALISAGLTAADIDLVAAHATGTPDNDAGEYAALSRVFGPQLPRTPVVAFKSHLGHTLGGAGAVELILSALCLRDQIIPACANIRADEIEFPGLNVSTGETRRAKLRATLNTSLGFGGANTCVVLGPPPKHSNDSAELKPPTEPSGSATGLHRGKNQREVFITGIGIVLPNIIGNEAFAKLLSSTEPRQVAQDTGPIPESAFIDLLNARRVRRMSDYVKLSLAATMLACRDAGISDIPAFAEICSALLGSTHGSANYSETYYRQIINEGVLAANPMLFAEGVPNAAAAHLSLMLSLKGPCQTVIGTRTAGLDAMHLASTRIASGEWDRAIVGAAEEYSPLVNSAYRHWNLHSDTAAAPFSNAPGGFVAGCGAVTLVLESASSMSARGIAPRGRILDSTGPLVRSPHSIRRTRELFSKLAIPRIISSANGTWLDRYESIATGRGCGPVVTSLVGHIAETYSVTPLAAIAAALLTGLMPTLVGSENSVMQPCAQVGILCSDYTGLLSAANIAIESSRIIQQA